MYATVSLPGVHVYSHDPEVSLGKVINETRGCQNTIGSTFNECNGENLLVAHFMGEARVISLGIHSEDRNQGCFLSKKALLRLAGTFTARSGSRATKENRAFFLKEEQRMAAVRSTEYCILR